MYQLQNMTSNPSRKELDRVTDANTFTEKPYSNFDTAHEELTSEGVNRNMFKFNQGKLFEGQEKTLTKVRSQPYTLLNHYEMSPNNVKDRIDMENRIDANGINYKDLQFTNLSPIPNRTKPHDINQTLNTNVESREVVGAQTTPSRTPKLFEGERIIKKPPSGYIQQVPRQVAQERYQQNINTVIQEQNARSSQVYASNVYQQPIANYRAAVINQQQPVVFNQNQPQGLRPQTFPRRSQQGVYQSYIYTQPQVAKQSAMTEFTSRQNQIPSQPTLQQTKASQVRTSFASPKQKISFSQIQQQFEPPLTDANQQVIIQRPDYKRIYSNKGEYYRTVGPQEDYYKENKTWCSRILPCFGVLALLMVLAGTVFGLGMLTGLIGGKNYLEKTEGKAIETVKLTQQTDNKFVNNQIQNGEVLSPNAPVVPMVIEQPKVQIPTTPVIEEPKVVIPVIPTIQEPKIVVPVTPGVQEPKIVDPVKPTVEQLKIIKPVLQIPKVDIPLPPVTPTEPIVPLTPVPKQQPITPQPEPVVTPVTPLPIPETKPETLIVNVEPVNIQPLVEVPTKPEVIAKPQPVTPQIQPAVAPETLKPVSERIPVSIEPVVIKPVAPVTISPVIIQPIQPKIEPVPVKPVQTVIPAQPIKPIEPKIQTIQPAIIPATITIQPVIQPVQPVIVPVTKPIEPTPTVIPTPKPITPQPQPTIYTTKPTTNITFLPQEPAITSQQAEKIVSTIIEENSQVIPSNIKPSLKSQILQDFEQAPLNFRHTRYVEQLAYTHIEALVSQEQSSHKATIVYKEHHLQN